MELTSLRTLLGFLRPYPWSLPVLVVLGLLASLFEGFGIGLLIPLLEMLLGNGAPQSGFFLDLVQGYAAGFNESLQLPMIAATIVGLIFLKSLFIYAHHVLSCWINGKVSQNLRNALFRKVVGLGHPFVARSDQGRLMNVMDVQTWHTSDALDYLFAMIVNASTVVIFATLLLLISWHMTLGVAVGVVLVSLVLRALTRRARALGQAAVTANAAACDRMLEALSGIRMISAFGQEAAENARFEAITDRMRQAFLRMERVAGLVHPLVELLYVPLLIGIALFAFRIGIGLPTLVAFLLLFYRLQPHIKNLEQNRVQLAGSAAAVTAVADLINHEEPSAVASGNLPFDGFRDRITFRNVSFRYDEAIDGHAAVKGISTEIRKGTVTAVAGPSGAGKSTLINLIYRFYDPVEGEIFVDGQPLRALDLASWRKRIALAGQDAELMSGTIAENIAYGDPSASRAAIEAAASRADAHAFITALPAGYETRVGTRGLMLSGGQRQRIGLARALLRNPEILILDEATNALDGLSETRIQATLEALPDAVTVIIIAHRLSTIRNADHVLVMQDGCIVEQGAPAELFEQHGHFARLHGLQTLPAAVGR